MAAERPVAPLAAALGKNAGAQGGRVRAAVPRPAAGAVSLAGLDDRQGEAPGRAWHVQRHVGGFLNGALDIALPVDESNSLCLHRCCSFPPSARASVGSLGWVAAGTMPCAD